MSWSKGEGLKGAQDFVGIRELSVLVSHHVGQEGNLSVSLSHALAFSNRQSTNQDLLMHADAFKFSASQQKRSVMVQES